MESRTQRVVVETRRHRIVGDLTLPREGYRSRISDYLNQGEVDFLPLANATITGPESERVEREFVAVGTAHIELAYPDADA